MSKIKAALIGAGQRGKDVYGQYALNNPEHIEFVAVAEPNRLKREAFAAMHNIPEACRFETWQPLLEQEKFCDAVIIASPDYMHYEPAKLALEKGYNILLEKPMSNSLQECVELGEISKRVNSVFMICHVLRYTPFFSEIKKIIAEGGIGQVLSIQHNENIGYYHFAHSFVRGNWRNSKETSPLILQKSCHDMDIMLWLAGSKCKQLSSFGSLSFFKEENAYKNAGTRCLTDCGIVEECPYAAQKLYFDNIGRWPTSVITEIQDKAHVVEALEKGPYGRCVFHCDNDVVDHQVTILEFENGVNATFNLSAFTNEVNRTIKVMGTKGVIRGNHIKNELEIQLFDKNEKLVVTPKQVAGGHGGGDTGIMEDFINLNLNRKGMALTSAQLSVQSHVMAFAAEKSRLEKVVVDIDGLYEAVKKDIG